MLTVASFGEISKSVSVRQHEHDNARYVIEGNVDGFQFALPVEHKINGATRSMFNVQVGGTKLTHEKITALPDAVIATIDEMLYAQRLPRYAFQMPGQSALLPVYSSGKRWMLHEPDGPMMEADDLSALQNHLANYLDSHVDHLALFELSSELRWVTRKKS